MPQHRSLALLACLIAACGSRNEAPAPPKPEPAQPKTGLDRVAPPLAAAIRALMTECKPPASGELLRCKPELMKALESAESSLGPIGALGQYCSAMAGSDAATRAVIANRIGPQSLHRLLAEQGSDDLLACLMAELTSAKDPQIAARLARPAAFLATAKKKEAPLLTFLESAPPGVRATGYECLWPNGRLRVLGALEKALAGDDPELRRHVLLGFAYTSSLQPEEQPQVCALLTRLQADADRAIASAAATRVGQLCPDSRGALLAEVEKLLKRKAIDLGFVNALRASLTTVPAPSAAERARILALLGKIASAPAVDSTTRQTALRYLAEVDGAAAAKLEKKHFPKPKAEPKKAEPKKAEPRKPAAAKTSKAS